MRLRSDSQKEFCFLGLRIIIYQITKVRVLGGWIFHCANNFAKMHSCEINRYVINLTYIHSNECAMFQ